MDRATANELISQAITEFAAVKSDRAYEISIRYEMMPEVFDVDSDELVEHPFEQPHIYRIGLAADGEVVFDGFFSDLPHAMATITRGIRTGIADESWPLWMATLESEWSAPGTS